MDILNKKKIAELEDIIKRQERELEDFRKERDRKNSGEHETGAWCEGCKNLIIYSALGRYSTQFCALDIENRCKDREV